MPKNVIAKKFVISSLIMGAASFAVQAADTANRGVNVNGQIIGNMHLQNDGENAMNDVAINQLQKCLIAIYNKVPTLRINQVNTAYNEVLNFINSQECKNKLRAQPVNAPQLPFRNPVNKPYAEMYQNALFALTGLQGPQSARHYQVTGIPINENIGSVNTDHGRREINMKDLLARVWTLISNHQNLQDVANMKSLLLKNLNDCVEDDGHLVCNIGKSERLMQSIEGFIEGVNFAVILPEVDIFCAAYVNELFKRLEPTDPLQFFITFEVPDAFSFENLEARIAKERESVAVRINGIYGANSPKAYDAIEKMENSFNQWKGAYYQNNDNLTPEQKAAGKKAVEEKSAVDQQARREARRVVEMHQATVRPVVQAARPVVQPVRPVIQAARPLVQAARPLVQAARPLVQAARPVVQAARPVVQAARPLVQAARPLVQAARPVVQAARPVVQAARPVVQAARPVVQQLTPKQAKAAQRALAQQAKQQARQAKAAQRSGARQAKAAQRALAQQAKQQARQAKAAQRALARQAKQQARQAKQQAKQRAQQAQQARRER